MDVIVSNPPYVAVTDRGALPDDVVRYEPATVLFGGEDGLDVMRVLIPAAAAALVPGGWLIMEMGLGQADEVQRLIRDAPDLDLVRLRSDLQRILRVVVARRSE